ncbi:ExbD/TolR family protein [Paraliomyxa miuraensis]|uniref:ExbD/TolR family protein n=1 Tax=Paraliomyxa miuraensis TaxID=376150 RepID=UPI002250BAD8|nr:biopolymer transporter ExbD [Paraliomyxa miuraensis]MCX4245530.1 biopolymer transporter ExbD [Paraliomyxa miuraensis]
MSISARASGLRARRRNRNQAMVELTPLIDIVFQLLIFFLLTTTFQNNPSFRVKLPKANNTDVKQEPKAVVVSVGADGKIEIEGRVIDDAQLEALLCNAASSDGSTGVNIRADAAAEHQYVVKVMDKAKTCGLERLGILHGR